jgi:hypothetical protein
MKYQGKNHVMIYGIHLMLLKCITILQIHAHSNLKYESRIMVNKCFLLVLYSPDFQQKFVQQ